MKFPVLYLKSKAYASGSHIVEVEGVYKPGVLTIEDVVNINITVNGDIVPLPIWQVIIFNDTQIDIFFASYRVSGEIITNEDGTKCVNFKM